MDKKFIFIAGGGLLVIIILIIVFVMTGSKGKVQDATNITSMTIWDYNDNKAAFDPVIQDFQKQINLKINYVVKNPASYLTDTVSAMAAGNGPDVWVVPANLMPNINDKLTPMPVGDFVNNDKMENDIENYKDVYPPVVAQDNILNNRIYGMPITIDKLMVYMNPQIIQDALTRYIQNHTAQDVSTMSAIARNPKTWDDLIKIDQLVTQKTGSQITQSAIALGTSQNINSSSDILTLLMMQNGAQMVSPDLGTAEFNTANNLFGNIEYPGTKALQFYASFADPKSPNYTWNNSMEDSIQAFAEGKTAMLIDYGSAAQEIQRLTPNLQYQNISLPQISQTANPVNLVKYDTLVVTKTTKIPITSWKFILEATNASYVGSYAAISHKTPVLGTSDADIYNAKTWFDPNPDQVETIFKDAIQQVNDGKAIQTAMDGAAGQVTTLLNNLKQTQTPS